MNVTFQDIEKASELLKGITVETPCVESHYLSHASQAHVYLKLEIFQETGAFKERGAYVKLKSLDDSQIKKGVIAVSAGNHAQAVAKHASNLGIPAVIVMPLNTPVTKVANTEKWGVEVVLYGANLDDAMVEADRIAIERSLTFVHPYNDAHVIAGQGTIGLEMLTSAPHLDVLIIPVGGGGLSSGIALAAKTIKPSIEIYGVQVEGYASMAKVLYNRTDTPHKGPTLAEGIATKSPGALCQEILKDRLKDILVVDEIAIEKAIDILIRKQNIVAEGAGAAGVAAFLENLPLFKGKKVGIVVCGGNIDSRILSSIMMRGRMRDGRIAHLEIIADDIPGSLLRVTKVFAELRANVIDIEHRRFYYQQPVKTTILDVMVETRNPQHVEEIIASVKAAGFKVSLINQGVSSASTDNTACCVGSKG